MSDGIVLIGLPGSGKTTAGRLVASRLGRPFVDIDEEVERMCGRTATQLLRDEGEQALRGFEREAVGSAVATTGAVIATGGGTVLDPLNRWALMEHGTRVRLDAPFDELARRLHADSTPRPLLGGDLADGLRRCADQRAPLYAAVDAAVDACGSPESVADAIVQVGQDRQHWRPLYDAPYGRHHPVGPQHGRLLMGVDITADALTAALEPLFDGAPPVVIADKHALATNPALDGALASGRLCVIGGGKSVKSFARLEEILGWLSDIGIERSDPLIVAGGGTVGDLGGLAAALHRRGIPLVQLPTTWLAQSDSAIGGKVAVDLPTAKNAVGAMWPAWLIFADVRLTDSLPVERRRDGIAECLKCGLIGDAVLWQLVEERGPRALSGADPSAAYAMTERAARLKLEIVDRDPFETGERRQLNLGHTIGHALEIESGYSLAHGEAVALGLRAVVSIAGNRGAPPELRERIDDVLAALGFPLRRAFNSAGVTRALTADKKRERGVLRWILPVDVGHVEVVSDVSEVELTMGLGAIAA